MLPSAANDSPGVAVGVMILCGSSETFVVWSFLVSFFRDNASIVINTYGCKILKFAYQIDTAFKAHPVNAMSLSHQHF